MLAGRSKIDITPSTSVGMDGMIRAHGSEGIHDPIHARALVIGNTESPEDTYALISVDICGMMTSDYSRIRKLVSEATGIPISQIIIAATHTHSGPAAYGFFDKKETEYVEDMISKIVQCTDEAFRFRMPSLVSAASGVEDTISNYRRLMSKSGKVIMNWEPFDPADIVGPLGVEDTEVGVLNFVSVQSGQPIAVFFNHAGHPNVMSGDNYLISGDYVGFAETKLESELSCVCAFFNGAQGTMDIDGLKDRDWDGVERAGGALAEAVKTTMKSGPAPTDSIIRSANVTFPVPIRKISDEEYEWACDIWEKCGGTLQPVADGVGDDYKAMLYTKLRESGETQILLEMTCIAIGDTALISFPGELFTEIGQVIKKNSPFTHTYIIGIANGCEGYFPTRQAISEGGYAEDTRQIDAETEDIVLHETAALLNKTFSK